MSMTKIARLRMAVVSYERSIWFVLEAQRSHSLCSIFPGEDYRVERLNMKLVVLEEVCFTICT